MNKNVETEPKPEQEELLDTGSVSEDTKGFIVGTQFDGGNGKWGHN